MTPFLVWSMLCLLTLVSMLVIGKTHRWMASIVVVLLAAAKSRLVIIHYMEVRRAARHWQLLYQTWIFAVTAAVLIGYLLSLGHLPA
jgi:hypothetical protein